MPKLYTRNTWVDRVLSGALRYDIKDNGGSSIYTQVQILLNTAVSVAGSLLSATWMNNIESGVDAIDTLVADRTAPITTAGTSTAFTLTTIGAPALATYELWHIVFNQTAGANPTLNRDSKGAKSLKYYNSAGNKIACNSIIVSGLVALVMYDGTDYVLLDPPPNVTTAIDGLKLIWNSATSLSVSTGSCFAPDSSFINISSLLTASGLSLSVSTWYHIYVYLSSGAAAMEVVTTAPTTWKGTAYGKTADTSRRYIGSVKTDASGNVYEFIHQDNIIQYKNVSAAASPFRVLSNGTATTATSIDLSGMVPITSRLANLRFYNGGTQACYTNEGSGVSTSVYFAGILAVAIQNQVGNHPINTSQAIYYLVTSGGSLYVDIMGYVYNR